MNLNYLFQIEINKIIDNCLWVICGHQVNILGGPIFVLYKWISTLVRAEQIGASPLFYMEGNDTDFFEINKVWFLDKNSKYKTFFWKQPQKNVSCGLLKVDQNLRKLLYSMLDSLPITQHTEWIRQIVLDSYKEGMLIPESTSKLIQHFFPKQKLYCFNATCPIYLKSIRFILERELEITPIGEKANVWGRKNGIRIALFKKEKNVWVDRNRKKVDCSTVDLLPNILTRSICQDFYFGTKEYIQGESEAKYLSISQDLYQIHKINVPERIFRMNPILVTKKTKLELDFLQLSPQVVSQTKFEDLYQRELIKKTGIYSRYHWQKMKYIKDNVVDRLLDLGISKHEVFRWEKRCYKDFRNLFLFWNKQRKIQCNDWTQKIKNVSNQCRPQGISQQKGYHIIDLLNQYGLDVIQKLQDACKRGDPLILLD